MSTWLMAVLLRNPVPHRVFNKETLYRLFLFLIAAEGLLGMMERATQIGNFQGFEVSPDIHHSLLQFADNTIRIGKRLR